MMQADDARELSRQADECNRHLERVEETVKKRATEGHRSARYTITGTGREKMRMSMKTRLEKLGYNVATGHPTSDSFFSLHISW
ncbi:hypothetical protein RPALISO_195 [Ruegeria phage RpAliso]|nr:hypothetical protein RPALISO_195 [Ruegeria phage RpAliso]